jgi:3-oxoadipate CoA-transferase, beta subunit
MANRLPLDEKKPVNETAAKVVAKCRPMTRAEMAARLARDIPEGWYVNLGIGAPLQVADYVPAEREVIFHSENGVLGMGPAPAPEAINRWLINAGKQYVTLRQGGAYMHHADSFGLIRGGHLDLCVLGAFQVAENGDIANWSISDNDSAPAVGGAMDLAVGARRVWVLMEHQTKSGESRLTRRCTYPLTALGVVKRVYTNLAVLDVTPDGFAVCDIVEGLTLEALQSVTDAPLHAQPH